MAQLGLPETLALDHLAIAAACGLTIGFGSVQLSGHLPLADSPLPRSGLGGKLGVLLALACSLATAILLLAFILVATAWAPALIAACLALLAGPLLFQSLPPKLVGGFSGLGALIAAEAILIAVLAQALMA